MNALSRLWRAHARPRLMLVFVLAAGIASGCRSVPPIAASDLSSPGWRVRQGQAVWKPSKTKPELTGELLLATSEDGAFLVQFTKTPFPFVTARQTGETWQIEFGGGSRRFSGRGAPPSRFVWFQLPGALAGRGPASSQVFTGDADKGWALENKRTGERLEGVFFP